MAAPDFSDPPKPRQGRPAEHQTKAFRLRAKEELLLQAARMYAAGVLHEAEVLRLAREYHRVASEPARRRYDGKRRRRPGS